MCIYALLAQNEIISTNEAEVSMSKKQKYADSSISNKAFKHIIFWFALYAILFCVGVVFAVGADMP